MSENIQETKNDTPREGYLHQGWLVLLLSVLYGGLLAWVQLTLGPVIEENKKQKTYAQIPVLVAGADAKKTVELSITADGKEKTVYHAHDSDGNPVGWVFPASGQGFADVIELLIGLDENAETIIGLFVLEQKETPGLGNFIKDRPEFAQQFTGLNAVKPLTAVASAQQGSNQITALTGATISSQSVCDIINSTVRKYRKAALAANLESRSQGLGVRDQ